MNSTDMDIMISFPIVLEYSNNLKYIIYMWLYSCNIIYCTYTYAQGTCIDIYANC